MKYLLFLTFLLISFLGYSQKDSTKNSELGLYTFGGVQIPNLKNINTFLTNNNYKHFPNEAFSGGFALYVKTKNIVNTVEISSYNMEGRLNGNYSSLRIFTGTISVGYEIGFSDKYAIIPSLALNVYNTTIKTSVPPSKDIEYEQFVTNGSIQEEVNGTGIGIGIRLTALVTPFDKWKQFFLGVNGGYNMTTSINWKTINNKNVEKVPEGEFIGANASLIVGIKF
jgi:hypothetical protein